MKKNRGLRGCQKQKSEELLDKMALRDFGTSKVSVAKRKAARLLSRELNCTPLEALNIIKKNHPPKQQRKYKVTGPSYDYTTQQDKPKKTVPAAAKPKLVLISKRSKRLNLDMKCAKCGVTHNPVWEYPESNWGRVVICSYCKPGKVFVRFTNGSFESGGRRK